MIREHDKPRPYRTLLLAVLTAAMALTYVDRSALTIVQQNIKVDLRLTDTELGVLNGIGFALFFALMGIPIARWADRGNRVVLVVLTTLLWSVTVAGCALANNFTLLLLLRIGTAIGESGCRPVANSLIPEYFSRAERPSVMGRYLTGAPIGATVGLLLSGWLVERFGWRQTFLVMGLPGLLLAGLAAWVLKEPRRDQYGKAADDPLADGPVRSATLKEVIRLLLTQRTLRHIWLCYVAWYFCGWGLSQWQPSFFIRSHGFLASEIGARFASITAVGGVLGSWLGGEWSTRYARDNERKQLRFAAIAFVLMGLCNGISMMAPNRSAALGWLLLATLFNCLVYAPISATIQTLVPGHMRATASTLSTLLPSFLGMGLGPTLVGALSDRLYPIAGEQSLRYALLILVPGFCWAAWHAWRASCWFEHDFAELHRQLGPAMEELVPKPLESAQCQTP